MAASPTQARILGELLSFVSSLENERPLVVFDLDDTLLSTGPRHRRILGEFAAQVHVQARYESGAEILSRVGLADLRYSITDTARVAGVSDEALLMELRAFWFDRFFTDEYLREDEPLPGAAAYCREVISRRGRVVYMTGRDEGMRGGTLRSLGRHGFPRPDEREVFLILKPSFDDPDLPFKSEAMARLAVLGQVAGAFENEPAHINLFQRAFSDGHMILLETKHSGKPVKPHPAVRRVKNFLLN